MARGEATGHFHGLFGGLFQMYLLGQQRFLKVEKESELRHQEHGLIKIGPGLYEIDIVKQQDHFKNETRRVQD